MKDLIDRQAAIDAVRKCSVKEVTPAYMLIDKPEAMTELMLLPSAQPEIIRCKECKHRDPEDKKCDCGHDIRWQLPRQDDWYCADAKRRTE